MASTTRLITRPMTAALAALAAVAVAGSLAAPPAALAGPDTGSVTDNGYNGAPIGRSGGPTPSLAGIPCIGSHFGACTSIAQNQPGASSSVAGFGPGR